LKRRALALIMVFVLMFGAMPGGTFASVDTVKTALTEYGSKLSDIDNEVADWSSVLVGGESGQVPSDISPTPYDLLMSGGYYGHIEGVAEELLQAAYDGLLLEKYNYVGHFDYTVTTEGAITLAIEDGQSTGYLNPDGSPTSKLTTEYSSGQIVLGDLMSDVQGLLETAVVGDQPGQYPQSAIDALNTALTATDERIYDWGTFNLGDKFYEAKKLDIVYQATLDTIVPFVEELVIKVLVDGTEVDLTRSDITHVDIEYITSTAGPFTVDSSDGNHFNYFAYGTDHDPSKFDGSDVTLNMTFEHNGEAYLISSEETLIFGENIFTYTSEDFNDVTYNSNALGFGNGAFSYVYNVGHQSNDYRGELQTINLEKRTEPINGYGVTIKNADASEWMQLYHYDDYMPVDNDTITADQNLQIEWMNDPATFGVKANVGELFVIGDTNGHEFAYTKHEENGSTYTENVIFEVINEAGSVVETYNILSAFKNTYADQWLDLTGLKGLYDVRISVPLVGDDYMVAEFADVAFDDSHEGGVDTDWKLRDFTYDDVNKNFTFRIMEDADLTGVNFLHMRVEGLYLNGFMPENVDGEIFKRHNIKLYDETAGQYLDNVTVQGRYRDGADPYQDKISFEIYREEDSTFPEIGLIPGHVYRIVPVMAEAEAMLDLLMTNIYVPVDDQNNMYIEVKHEEFNNTGSDRMYFGEGRYQKSGNTADTLPTGFVFEADRHFYYVGNNIELPIQKPYGADLNTLVVKLATGDDGLDISNMSSAPFALYDGDTKLVDGEFELVESSFGTEVFYKFDLSSVDNVDSWIIKGDGTESLRRSFETFDHLNWMDRNISMLAYDVSENLIGLYGFNGSMTKVIVDPALRIGFDEDSNQVIDTNESDILYDGDTTRILGREYYNVDHWSEVDFRIKATDTGIMNVNRIAVEVTVEAEGEAPIHTYVTMGGDGIESYYSTNFRLRSIDFDNHIELPPADFDPVAYQTDNSGAWYNDVPVYSSKMNTLTFSLDNGLGDVVTKIVEYYPNNARDFVDGDWMSIKNDRIGPNLKKLRLKLPGFVGNENNLSVKFHTIDTLPSEGTDSEGLGSFEAVLDRTDWIETYEDTLTGEVYENARTTFTFGPDEDDMVDFTSVSEGEQIFVEVIYHENFQSTDGSFTHDVTAGFSGDNGRDFYLGSPKINHVQFYKIENVSDTTLYGFEVYLDPGVFLEDLDPNMFMVYDYEIDQDTGIRPVKFEMHPEDQDDEYRRASDPTYRFLMFFDQEVSDYDVHINDVLTASGQRLDYTHEEELEVRSRVEGYMRRADYSAFADNEIMLASLDEIAHIDELTALFMQDHMSVAGLDNVDMDRDWMQTSTDGFFDEHMTSGDFRVLAYSECIDDKNSSHRYGLHMDDFYIPIVNGWESVSVSLQERPSNVLATMPRVDGHETVDEFMVLTADAQAVLLEMRTFMNSTEFDTLSDFERDNYYDLRHYIYEVYGFRMRTDLSGQIETYMRPGQYVITDRIYGGSSYGLETPIEFTVQETGVTDMGVLPFEAANTFIKILDSEGVPVTNARVNIGGPTYKYGMTDELGVLAVYMETEGTYQLDHVETSWETEGDGQNYQLEGSGEAQFNFVSETDEYLIQLPVPTQTARTVNGSTPVALEDAYLETTWGGLNSSTGIWKFYGYEGAQVEYIELHDVDIDFEPTLELTADTVLDIQDYINFVVKIVSPSGEPLPGRMIGIDIHGHNGFEGISADDGSAYFILDTDEMDSDREYEISTRWVMYNGETTRLDMDFKDVYDADGDGDTSEMLIITPEMLQSGTVVAELEIVAPNFVGKITNEGLYRDGWINIERVDDNGNDDWIHSNIDRLTGEFSFIITEPGQYIVRNAGHKEEYSEINFAFIAVEDENGIISIKDVNDQNLAMPLTLSLGQDNANFKGQLFKMGTTPFGDPSVVGHIDMKIVKEGVDERIFQKWIQVNPNGEFNCFLDPFGTPQYKIMEINTYYHNYNFDAGIPITLDEGNNQVVVPAFNFTGTATDYDGNKPFQGDLNIEYIEMIDGQEVVNYDHVRIDPVGDFVDMMEDGMKIVIRDLWYIFDGEEYGQHFRFQMPVTVGQNSTGIMLSPNLKGSIDYSGLVEEDPGHLSISFRPVFDREDFESDADFNTYKNEPWQYDYWTDVKYEAGAGTFYMYMPEGDYIIRGLDLNGQYMDMNYGVTLAADGSIHNATLVDGKYQMSLTLSDLFNASGVLKDENAQLITDAWVSVEKMGADWTYGSNNDWFGGRTDDTGTFRLNLDEGHYMLNSYHREGYWDNGQWRDGDHVDVKRKFMINASGDLLDENGNALANLNVQPNVTGTVQGYKDGAYFEVVDAWFRIAPLESGDVKYQDSIHGNTGWEDNTFSLMLSPGEYRVLEAGGRNTWFELNQDFTVDEGQTTQLSIKPAEPNFEGVAAFDAEGTKLLKWGHIAVKPADAPDYDWEKAIHIETDGEGQFARKIPEGNWVIVDMGNHNNWERLDINFSVDASGNIISTEMTTGADGYLVAPPRANFTGQILDESSSEVNDHAWMIVKPATASAHDWSEANWIEMKYRDDAWAFAEHLDAGDYRVVEAGGPGFWYMTNLMFAVVDGQVTNLTVQPQQPNFTATVYNGETTESDVMAYSWMNFMRVDESGNQVSYLTGEALDVNDEIDWSETNGVHVNDQGMVELILEETADYQLISVGGGQNYYETSLTFSVSDSGMAITRPVMPTVVTLTDVPTHMLDTGVVDTAWLIGRTGTPENYDYYELEGVETDINSQTFEFKGEWNDGEYQLIYLFSDQGELLMDQMETVSDGSMGTLTMEDTTKCDVTVTFEVDGVTVTDAISVTIEVTLPDVSTEKMTIKTDTAGTATVSITKNADWKVVEMGTKDGYFALTGQTVVSVPDQDEQVVESAYNITRP